jgi:CRP/FNR family transcriptional regulator, anaerobic regulatory protein
MKKLSAAYTQPTVAQTTVTNETTRACGQIDAYFPPELMSCGTNAIASITRHQRALRKGEYLYHMGDTLTSLHIIRSGSIKTSRLTTDGRIQVIGFHVSGDVIGVDAICAMQHPSNAVALEPTELCVIPYFWLEELAQNQRELQRGLLQLLSREIVRDEELLLMLGRQNAEARLASCLLNLSSRAPAGNGDGRHLTLSMSRQDLADYLGLAVETVSRLFSRLQEQGILQVSNRRIHLLDRARLEILVECCTSSHRLQA